MTRADKIRVGIALLLMAGSVALGIWIVLHPRPYVEEQISR